MLEPDTDDPQDEPEAELEPDLPAVQDDELPVVARLVIEVRSDGSRTIARGGLEDRTTGQRVSLEAEGASPLELSAKLARSLMANPLWLGVQSVGGLRKRIKDSVTRRIKNRLPFRRDDG